MLNRNTIISESKRSQPIYYELLFHMSEKQAQEI